MKPRFKTLALLGILVAYVIGARDQIWYEIQPWPRWWKILLAIGFGTFVTLVMLWACGLEYLLFQILNIQNPM